MNIHVLRMCSFSDLLFCVYIFMIVQSCVAHVSTFWFGVLCDIRVMNIHVLRIC